MKIDPDSLPSPNEPYRGILPFRLLDWRIFLERDAQTERLANLVSIYRGVLLYGQSGAGKSSLLNAGLLPDALRRGRAPERIRVLPVCGHELVIERILLREDDARGSANDLPRYLPSRFCSDDNLEQVSLSCDDLLKQLHEPSDLGVPLLIFDQFEELVTLFEENPKDKERLEEATQARNAIGRLVCELLLRDPMSLKIVFAFRDDYLARLAPLFSQIPNLMDQAVHLMPPRIDVVKKIVRGPFVESADGRRGLPGHFQSELGDEQAARIEEGIRERRLSGILNLSEVQTICLALWRLPKRRDELLQAADPAAVLQNIIETEALAALQKFRPWARYAAIALLANLVTKEGTRDVVSEDKLIGETRRNLRVWFYRGNWQTLLEDLHKKTGLLRCSLSDGNTYYELASEFLVPWIQTRQQEFRRWERVFWMYISAGLVALLALLGVYYLRARRETKRADAETAAAESAERDAVREREAAYNFINFLQYDLRDYLRAHGSLDMLQEISFRLTRYYEQHPPQEGNLYDQRARAPSIELQGDILFTKGSLKEAFQQYQELLSISQELVNKKPDDADYQRVLGVSCVHVGDALSVLGDLAGALKKYRDSLAAREKLVKQDPNNADLQCDLSASHNCVGDVSRAQGDLAGALKSYRVSFDIAQRLVEKDPPNAMWQQNLCLAHERIGDVLRARGDLPGALKSYRAGFDIAQTLLEQDPLNAGLQQNLSVAHERMGNVSRAQGDLPGALKSYRASFDIAKMLALQDMGNAMWQQNLSLAHGKIGDVLRAQGDLAGALEDYRASFHIAQTLAQQDPDNAVWQQELSAIDEELGNILRDQRDLAGALTSYRECFAICEKLARQDPSNTDWQSGLADSYTDIGQVLHDQRDFSGALKNYRDGLDIREKLAKQDPGNAERQADLADSYTDIGEALHDQGDLSDALKNYRDGLAIREKLAKQDPTNAEWQGNLAFSCWKTGITLAKVEPKSRADARAMVKKAGELLHTLKQHASLTALQQSWVGEIQASLRQI